ncbi:UNVERIFIED_CONTAM: hypothetical protein Sradi_1437200 [Sesamum radiatum]|uniref:Uncharacterized protein n=1 Tax=Sesamum radiatum TaxID=300843 RepID=A0AAW2U613_SESRA
MLESLLSYLSGTKAQARQSGWSLVSKLIHSKKASYQGEGMDVNEFQKMDAFLQVSLEDIHVEEVMAQAKEMESSIQNLEEELECLFRQLIKTRVFLLTFSTTRLFPPDGLKRFCNSGKIDVYTCT